MSVMLRDAERLKFAVLADGVTVTEGASSYLRDVNAGRQLTPADYASTSGLILRLDDDVWVNAPIAEYNWNFVGESPYVLDRTSEGLALHGRGLESRAHFWMTPSYHGQKGADGTAYNYSVFTHGDRGRLSPIQGCAMRCKFCNIPYEDRYRTKSMDIMIEAVERAVSDPVQPARHLLISGGTPAERDIPFLRGVYERMLTSFPDVCIDIMMVPVEGLLDVRRLDALGLHELSINVELRNDVRARAYMRQKHMRDFDDYLDFLGGAAEILGPGRVRSMLMVGLEPLEDTLEGVKAIAERGGVPVLSPFRPDPATPLKDVPPPSAVQLEEAYLRATEVAQAAGAELGPSCPPCTHNTLTLPGAQPNGAVYAHPVPLVA